MRLKKTYSIILICLLAEMSIWTCYFLELLQDRFSFPAKRDAEISSPCEALFCAKGLHVVAAIGIVPALTKKIKRMEKREREIERDSERDRERERERV